MSFEPLLAAANASNVADDLAALFWLLLAAKLGEELFTRLRQPAIAGAILGGVVAGPSVLSLVDHDGVVAVFAELGVIFLLFWVGLETRVSDLTSVGRVASSVGVLGVVVPTVTGIGLALALGAEMATAVFTGAALAATSVGITSAILVELGIHETRAGRTILGAAIIDDVLALILLAVASGIAATGSVDVLDVLGVTGIAVAFLLFVVLGGTRLLRRAPASLEAPRSVDNPLIPAVIVCLGLAVLSEEIGLAAVIGAFVAGMVIAETRDQYPVEREVAPLNEFFAPFFFASIGTLVDLSQLGSREALGLVAGLTAVAVITKYAGSLLGGRGLAREERRIVAAGMVPRGEVGVIVAGIGYASGVVDERLFAVVVAMAVLTTLVAPYMIRAAAASGLRAPASDSA